jgi:23S rRNA pseudouridine1911/1915/1917 synthase
MTLEVLYEDNHVIVCYKPAGVLSQADNTGDIDMLTLVKDYLKKRYNKEGNVFVGLVHRLDRMTSGVMVFGKTSKGAMRLSNDIANGDFFKEYLAVCEGNIENYDETTLVDYLEKDEKNNKSFISKNGKEAILTYRVITNKNNKSLVRVKLKTGRHHQIRVQMSNIGHPLYGDIKYGSPHKDNLALQAYKLSFYQPVTRELLTFQKINYSGVFAIFK